MARSREHQEPEARVEKAVLRRTQRAGGLATAQFVRTLAVTLLLGWSAKAAADAVTCTLFVGGKASDTQVRELESQDPVRNRLFFEANMFHGHVDISTDGSAVEVDMTLTRRGRNFPDEVVFGVLRGTRQAPAAHTVSVVNSDLVCEIN